MNKGLSNREIEDRLKTSVEHLTPDIRSRIIERCKEESEPVLIHNKNKSHLKRVRLYQFIAAAAVLFLAFSIVIPLMRKQKFEDVAAVIDIDVNPSIELSINKHDRVVKVKAVNDDAKTVLENMDLKGTQTNVAINAIMGSMLEHGYLKTDTRYVLVSVESKSKVSSKELEQKVCSDMDTILSNYSVDAQILTQVMTNDDNVADISDVYGVSQGKATLIKHIMLMDSSYYEDELSRMSISELDALLTELEQRVPSADSIVEITYVTASDLAVDDTAVSSSLDEEPAVDVMADEEVDDTVSSNEAEMDSVSDNKVEDTVSENSISSNSVSDNKANNEDINTKEDNEEEP